MPDKKIPKDAEANRRLFAYLMQHHRAEIRDLMIAAKGTAAERISVKDGWTPDGKVLADFTTRLSGRVGSILAKRFQVDLTDSDEEEFSTWFFLRILDRFNYRRIAKAIFLGIKPEDFRG